MRDGALTAAALSVLVDGTGCAMSMASWSANVTMNIIACGIVASWPIGRWNEQGGSNGNHWKIYGGENDIGKGVPNLPSSICHLSLAELGIQVQATWKRLQDHRSLFLALPTRTEKPVRNRTEAE
jgi:hypothetical protein